MESFRGVARARKGAPQLFPGIDRGGLLGAAKILISEKLATSSL